MTWLLLDSGPGEAGLNMALDEALLEAAPRLGRPVLRWYGWTQPAASFGYFQKYAEVERLTPLRPLVRRPTAGGIVPHDADWTYSLAFPADSAWYGLRAVESYQRVHQWIQAALATLGARVDLAPHAAKSGAGQCFVGYEQSDLLWCGRKIAGAAQRRTRNGLLIQGSLQPAALGLARAAWQSALCHTVPSAEPVPWEVLVPDDALQKRVLELLQQKYSQPAYHQKR